MKGKLERQYQEIDNRNTIKNAIADQKARLSRNDARYLADECPTAIWKIQRSTIGF